MALAPLLYNITFDSQTRILYFWDKAGHEIYHCEIPSPAPALPTVTKISYYYNHNHFEGSVSAGGTKDINTWEGAGVPYDDTTKKQCVYGWRNAQLTAQGYGCFETVDYQDWGIVGAKNITSSTITQIYIFRYAECASPDATVITVYNSSNNPYNAFKYTSDGTDYYYVLDGTQTDWTDDLSSIGYSLVNVYKSWVSASKSQETVSTSMNQYLYNDNGNFIAADDSKTYTIISVDGNTSSDILSKLAIINTHIATPERLGIKAQNNTYWEIQMTYVEYTIS